MRLRSLRAHESIVTILFGIFLLFGLVHCDDDSFGEIDDDDMDGQNEDTEEGISGATDNELEGECDIPNLTRPCCDGWGVQVCTEDLKWSACDCYEDPQETDDDTQGETLEGGDGISVPEGNLRTDISFQWDESAGGYADCPAGKYTGNWKCTRQGMTFKGPVTMTLKESVNGEFLEIADGELTGKAMGGAYTFLCTLAGGLDRTKNEFEAEAVDGVFKSPMLANGKFTGTLTGECAQGSISIVGEWSLTDSITNVVCIGPWSITLTNDSP